MNRLAEILRERKDELSILMASEMGKPVKQGLAEVEKCALCCEYYATHGKDFLKDQIIETEASKSYASFQPIGVVLAVTRARHQVYLGYDPGSKSKFTEELMGV